MLSTMLPLLSCWTNLLKKRNASCSATMFAMRNVRRSGSLTLSNCAASFAFTSGRAK